MSSVVYINVNYDYLMCVFKFFKVNKVNKTIFNKAITN